MPSLLRAMEEETAIENVETIQVEVYAVGHTIYVKNARDKTVSIYDNNGRYMTFNDNGENEYFVETIGVYHVFVDDTSYSVVIK